MRKPRERIGHRGFAIRLGLVLGVAALVIVGYLTLANSTQSSLETVTLDGVSAEDLAKNGLILAAPPTGYTPTVTASQATAAVAKYNPGAKVRQVVLARVLNETAVPKMDRVLWVANLDVEGKTMGLHGGPGMPQSTPYLYSLILIDPSTGVVLGEVSMGAPIAPK